MLRVDLRKWVRKNRKYIAAWIGMGLVLMGLLVRKIGVDILFLIGPFLPYLALSLARMASEVKR